MTRTAIGIFTLCVLACAGTASATTWVVDQGAGGDASTIVAGLALAGSGDTVLVRVGTYTEHVTMVDGVVLISESGRDVTIIEAGLIGPPVITCSGLGPGTTIEGFTIRGGNTSLGSGISCTGSSIDILNNRITDNFSDDDGGGVAYVDGGWAVISGNIFERNVATDRGGALLCENSSPDITDNVFKENRGAFGAGLCCVRIASSDVTGNEFTDNFSTKWGGGIVCMSSSDPEITFNTFESDTALGFEAGSGGGIHCWGYCSPVISNNTFTSCFAWHGGGVGVSDHSTGVIEENTFTYCSGEYGGAIWNHGGSSSSIVGNTFEYNTSTKWGGAICFRDSASGTIDDNLISHNYAAGGGGGIKCWNGCDATVTNNILWANENSYGGAISASNMCFVDCSQNTFYANEGALTGSAIDSHNGSLVDIRNCIIAASVGGAAIYCWEGGTATSNCNDLWGNSSDYFGCVAGPSDFYLDPMLCDPDHGNFFIDCESPCKDYPGCGLVGAMGVGCGSTTTESTSWGAVKALWK